jgi:hypothetical protein
MVAEWNGDTLKEVSPSPSALTNRINNLTQNKTLSKSSRVRTVSTNQLPKDPFIRDKFAQ